MTAYLPKVLITGASGQIANAIIHHVDSTEVFLIACTRKALDITHTEQVKAVIGEFKPDFVINTAAYVAVDKAEQEKELAMQVNHQGTANLAIACHDHDIPLIHISTDYIFDGMKTTPYIEDDAANPLNTYGLSKWLGEKAVREYCSKHIILRVSGVFSEHGQNFYKTILRLAREKRELTVISDQITCPTYAGDIAGVLLQMTRETPLWGTYHYGSAESTSWFDFAEAIIAEARLREALVVENVKPISYRDYPTPAKRPAYSVLDSRKIVQEMGILLPSWRRHLSFG